MATTQPYGIVNVSFAKFHMVFTAMQCERFKVYQTEIIFDCTGTGQAFDEAMQTSAYRNWKAHRAAKSVSRAGEDLMDRNCLIGCEIGSSEIWRCEEQSRRR